MNKESECSMTDESEELPAVGSIMDYIVGEKTYKLLVTKISNGLAVCDILCGESVAFNGFESKSVYLTARDVKKSCKLIT